MLAGGGEGANVPGHVLVPRRRGRPVGFADPNPHSQSWRQLQWVGEVMVIGWHVTVNNDVWGGGLPEALPARIRLACTERFG